MQNTTSAPMTDTTGMSEQRIRFEIARLTRLACSYPAQDAYYLWQEIDRLQKLVGR